MASADNSDVLQSSQAFVRALKSAADPPYENGPSKIEIAKLGWDSQALYVPRKADLILEWILTRFHKEKSKKSHENPLIDPAHWSLLAEILAHPDDIHIVPLVTRTSIPALLSSFLALYPLIPDSSRDSLLHPILRSLNVLWPLAVQRAGIDPLSECLWTSLPVFDQIYNNLEQNRLGDILDLVLTAFRSAFDNANAAGKKKAYLALVQNQLLPWLHAIHFLPPTHSLHDQLYAVGTEILLNPDALRTSLETNPNANASTDIFSTLFGSSIKSDQDSHITLLALFPRLTTSYFTALRKHRSTIFAGTPAGQQARERLRYATTRFGSECLAFLKDSESNAEVIVSTWTARVGVLAVLEADALFNYTGNDDIADKVREMVSNAIQVLDRAWDDSHSPLVAHALDTLSCLHRVEPDILTPFIPQVLERLATCSATVSHSSGIFLSQLVSYHSKTRTLHTFVSLLLAAVTSTFSFLPPSDAQTIYGISARSPLVSLKFTDELASALGAFMTPGQADAIVNSIHTMLESSFHGLESSGEPARKRRRVSLDEDVEIHTENQDDSTSHVVKFTLVTRLAATTLTAVLQGSTRGDAAERRKACLEHVDSLISGALEASLKAKNGGLAKASKKGKGKRSLQQEDADARWRMDCFPAALLRLWYDLFARSGSPGTEMDGETDWSSPGVLDHLHPELMMHMRDVDAQPELQLEIGRVLYARGASSRQEEDIQDTKGLSALDTVLDYIESSLFASGLDLADLTRQRFAVFTRRETALALWGLTVERYMSVVDSQASQAQLDRLTNLMIRVRFNSHVAGEIQRTSERFVIARAMASASFWEFSNIRTSCLATLDKQTVEFTSVDVQKWLTALVHGDSKAVKALLNARDKSLEGVEAWIEVYRFLHYFPPEYLSRSSRLELAKRALVADVLVHALSRKSEHTMPELAEWRAVLRSFVVMVAKQTQTRTLDEIASLPEWMPYLTLSKHAPTVQHESFIGTTLSLLSLIYMSAIRAASSTEAKDNNLINIIAHFTGCISFFGSNMQGECLAQQSLLRFVFILIRDFKVSGFTSNVLGLLRRLCSDFESALKPAISDAISRPAGSELLESGHIIEAWTVLLSFKQWLSISLETNAIGETILKNTAQIISSSSSPTVPHEFRMKVLSLLIQQGRMFPEEECQYIGIIAAAYILFTNSKHADAPSYDELIAQASKTLSVVQFEAFLGFVAEGMESSSSAQSELDPGSLVHLSKVLLREAPEGTSKVSHEHVTRCLRVFINMPAFIECPTLLCMQVLDFVHSQCIERAASLRISNIACLWPMLSRLLVGSVDHDEHTSASIFRTIVSIINALVRLRRDLVSPHLPQLSMVLRQLIMVIRCVRPLLGLKQHHLVSDTLPKWVNPNDPLGDEEARALARVLTALTTKSLIRSHISNEGQKAESLARPFARHAPYVLLAYIQLMNDHLSVLSMGVRRELEPGLYALCGIMGEHGRDTLMVQSLDVGGKAMLKSLWKGYEKQKYVGRG